MFSRTMTRSTSSYRERTPSYDLHGRRQAYNPSSCRSATLTERKPVPIGVVIGPFRATPFAFTDASVSSGSGVPASSITSTPAWCTSHSSSTPVASRTRRVASVSSGPVPSPGMRVTRWAIAAADRTCMPAESLQVASCRNERSRGLQARARRGRRGRDRDRRARPRRRRPPLSGRRHRGARRPLPVRAGVGPPGRRRPRLGHARAGALRAGGSHRATHRPIFRPRRRASRDTWGLGKLNEISDEQAREDLGRLSSQMMGIVARSARLADGATRSDSGRRRPTAAAPPPRGSSCSGEARPTRDT